MKIFICYIICFICGFAFSQTNPNHVWVNGYTRSDGTQVEGHFRTAPNSTNSDNFSTIGNTNPYTGEAGYIPSDGGVPNNYYNSNEVPIYNTYNSLDTEEEIRKILNESRDAEYNVEELLRKFREAAKSNDSENYFHSTDNGSYISTLGNSENEVSTYEYDNSSVSYTEYDIDDVEDYDTNPLANFEDNKTHLNNYSAPVLENNNVYQNNDDKDSNSSSGILYFLIGIVIIGILFSSKK